MTAERTAKASPEARRAVAAILEVWGGVRTPQQAASALGLSVPRYYQIEQRAVGAIVAACEPRPRGPGVGGERQVRVLERQLAAGRRDVSRLQALLRTSQRTIGLPLAEPAKGQATGRRGARYGDRDIPGRGPRSWRRCFRPTRLEKKAERRRTTAGYGRGAMRVVSPAAPGATGGSP